MDVDRIFRRHVRDSHCLGAKFPPQLGSGSRFIWEHYRVPVNTLGKFVYFKINRATLIHNTFSRGRMYRGENVTRCGKLLTSSGRLIASPGIASVLRVHFSIKEKSLVYWSGIEFRSS